jgi:DNA adenine methylase
MVNLSLSMALTPFVKWAGGKRQLMANLMELKPKIYNKYYEPFVGGGALFLELAPNKASINDYNQELILVYKSLSDKKSFNELYRLCKEHEALHNEEYYYSIRALDTQPGYSELPLPVRAARCIYLNKACFNGLYRVNAKGQFNVPFNGKTKVKLFDEDNIQALHQYFLSNDISIHNGDYQLILDKPKKGDFVYFDPPYDVVGNQSFTTYTKVGFGRDEQTRLRDNFKNLSDKGVYVMLSNSNTEFIRELYKDFNIHIVQARRNINSQSSGRGKVEEVIVTNY